MANKNELKILKELESDGWKVLNRGAPDFLCIKVDNGNIEDFKFVEVKLYPNTLTYEQTIYRKVLEKLGAKFEIRYVNTQAKPDQTIPNQTRPFQTRPNQSIPAHARPNHP